MDFYYANQQAILTAVGALSGIIAHNAVYIRGEWHVQAPQITIQLFALYVGCPVLAQTLKDTAIARFLQGVIFWSYGYLPGLIASILLYRVFFHPLTRTGFRGPWYKYGSFVRTGPAEITVFHPDVFMAVDGPRSECVKSEWYDILHPGQALVTARNKSVHAIRRREWNAGFTTKALAEHEAKILKYVDKLDQCIEQDAKLQKVTNMRDLLLWFGFDIMGDFVFSKSFGMLENQQWHHIIVRLQRALSLLGPFSSVPWLIQVGFNLAPRVSVLKDWFDTVAWCQSQMRDRLENGSSSQSQDLSYYLMEKDSEGHGFSENEKWHWAAGDSLLAIVAGSEPTAVALIAVFCELGKHPEHAEKIHEEVKNVDVTDLKTLVNLPHLNAVMKESLRLHPALLTGGNRKTTEFGLTIGDQFIPPNTTIVAPRYTIGRLESCFEKASEFVPERWTTRPEMVRNAAAYAPFGTGHHSCLGKTLALDTMKYVLARILKNYRFRAAPGDDSLSALETVKDQFTSNPGTLKLQFERRHATD
ncbi:cytochrome p450 domain-containing protein [Trichoderma breve]|uniref:Cytochrome p450 domain-containing protein n=1 Tax=Trichoderma breve TaxID=2034170 RepID=A0A9W9E6C6_9HYPO|nr:cytochrome p450 domain-containing protein [Trichoderma breve]KAJ4859774.1 cytochrome p450 domain-containing protein [Trichoderma breve]